MDFPVNFCYIQDSSGGYSMQKRDARRVVVTGLGAVTPIGVGVQGFWQGLIAGKSGVGRVTHFDP
jgi:3-oxoacyl-[acyl-carrier-protein] synthase II